MRIRIGPYKNYNKKTGKTPDRFVKIQIEKFDTWSMDHTLALIIHPMLIQLKATNHGAPNTDDEDAPEHLRSTNAAPKENEWDTDSLWFDRWNWIMDEMIWAFAQIIDDEAESKFYSPLNREGLDAHNKRIQNGTRLFGKYYQALWD